MEVRSQSPLYPPTSTDKGGQEGQANQQRSLTPRCNIHLNVLHAKDVKSCFRQLKHHPDVMGAFSYILGDYLFLQCGQSFGSVFSPANWEIVRRVAEQLAEAYYEDDSLKEKHRKYLDKLQWQSSLGDLHARFTRAKQCSINQGVKGPDGVDSNTSHHFFVDDNLLYAEVFNIERLRWPCSNFHTSGGI